MERYIGLDAHATSCTFSVVGERGRRLQSAVVATNGRALVEFLETDPGRRHLCLEEGTQSGWMYEILAPHVDECVVTAVPERRGAKDDRRDAFACAQCVFFSPASGCNDRFIVGPVLTGHQFCAEKGFEFASFVGSSVSSSARRSEIMLSGDATRLDLMVALGCQFNCVGGAEILCCRD